MTKRESLEKRLTAILTCGVLDSIIRSVAEGDLQWFGESPVLVEIAAPDTVLCLNQESLDDIIECHLNASLRESDDQ